MPFLDGALTSAVAKLWLDGLTGGQIAARLKLSRSAVMGRLFRLRASDPNVLRARAKMPPPSPKGLRRPRPQSEVNIIIKKRNNVHLRQPAYALRATAGKQVSVAVPMAALPLLTLPLPSGAQLPWHSNRGCHYIANDDPHAPAWCNAPVVPGLPWCAFHYQRLSVAPRR